MSAFNPNTLDPQAEDDLLRTSKKILATIRDMPTRTVSTVAQMVALTDLSAGTVISVAYGSTPGDGLGGTYEYRGTAYDLPDLITQFNQTSGGGSFTALATKALERQSSEKKIRLVCAGVTAYGLTPQLPFYTCGTALKTLRFARKTTKFRLIFSGIDLAGNTFPGEKHTGLTGEIKVAISQMDFATGASELCRIPVFFNGRRIHRLPNTSYLVSDWIDLPMEAGQLMRVYTFANKLASASYSFAGEAGNLAADVDYMPLDFQPANDSAGLPAFSSWNTSDGFKYTGSTGIDPSTLDLTDSGSFTSQDNLCISPVAVEGICDDDGPLSVGGVGTSIMRGSADTGQFIRQAGQRGGGQGWLMRAIYDSNPAFRAARDGETCENRIGPSAYDYRNRMLYVGNCECVITEGGTNDLNGSRTVAAIKADMLAFWQSLRDHGVRRIIAVTIIPRGSSTDAFQSEANQTPWAKLAQANELNAWLKTLPGGIDACFDANLAVETAPESGLWKPNAALRTVACTSGSSTTAIVYPAATFTSNEYAGCQLMIGGEVRRIRSNTTTTITVAVAFSGAPSSGTSTTILDQYTVDGVHPTPLGHAAIAAEFQAQATAGGWLL